MQKQNSRIIKKTSDGNLFFDNVDLKEMGEKYKTPFFLFSEKQLIENYKNFLEAFSSIPKFKVFYSVKTNYESEILRTLRRLGSGAEIGGGLDFYAAQKAGFSPENIIFDGPCKEKESLLKAVDLNIHCINLESLQEAQELENIASQKNSLINVGLRIDPLVDNAFYDKVIDTYKRKFGYPITKARDVCFKIKRLPHLKLMAIHAHIGSQMINPSIYQKALEKIFQLVAELNKSGVEIKEINIGGGFPVQSMRNLVISKRIKMAQFLERLGVKIEKQIPSIFDFGKAISKTFEENSKKYNIYPALHTEPGRSIVSSTSVVIGKILRVKKEWAFTDISVNDIPENIFFAEREFEIAGKINQEKNIVTSISGPTLATADVIFLKTKVPQLKKGDILAIFDTGAYLISRSHQFTRPRKAAYFKTVGGELKTIRRSETYEDVTKNQSW